MKKMKRLVALALSVVMVLAMSVVAFAATGDDASEETTYTITAPNNGHTYEVYQIFTGKFSTKTENGKTETILSDVKWGKNGKGGTKGEAVSSTILEEIKETTGSSDTEKLAVITKYVELTATNKYGEVSSAKSLKNVPAGYYLIKDTDEKYNGENDSYTKYIVEIAGDLTIQPKTDKPEVEKKVQENQATKRPSESNTYGEGYNDVADYNIGDEVPFHLIGKVPDMSAYNTYKYIFHDTLSAGLTAPSNVRVYLSNDKTVANATQITEGFFVKVDGQEITVSFPNLKSVITNATTQKYVIVEYNAVLNEKANIGLPGNENKVNLEYSNNPNAGGEGETGKTPDDKVIVFTYELDVTKVDGKNTDTKLEGAEFKLRNSENKWATVNPAGKITGWVDSQESGSVLTSDSDGLFKVIGLDDGTYYLKETKAPSGYNILEGDITVIVSATTANNQGWQGTASDALTAIKVDVTAGGKTTTTNGDTQKGSVSITVENNKGSNLPSTGGIGTTIFYVVGGILMAGAAVLLITKRRAEN